MDVDTEYIALLKWFTMESMANEPNKMDQSYLIKSLHVWKVRLDGDVVHYGWAVFKDCTPNSSSTDVSNPDSDDCGLQV
jgi:hypothetical protein